MALVATALVACGDDEEGSVEELCAALEDRSAFSAVFEGFDPTDTDRAIEQLRTARVQLGELRDAAPREIHDELDIEIDGVQQLIEALEGVEPGNSTEAIEAVRALEDELEGMGQATEALDRWVTERC